MNDQDDIEALALNILGMRFALLLEPLDVGKYPFLREAKYRPGRIVISHPFSTNWGPISWDDGGAHDDLTVQFVRPVTRDPRPAQRRAGRCAAGSGPRLRRAVGRVVPQPDSRGAATGTALHMDLSLLQGSCLGGVGAGV
jgi:hypothetical protein